MAPRFSASGKRLGRPPKNPQPVSEGSTFTVITPAVAKKEEVKPVEVDPSSMIPCEFVGIAQHEIFNDPKSDRKSGRYSSSTYYIDGFNNDRWVVLSYVKTDFEKYRAEGLSNTEIAKRCINYLNAVEPRKKFPKKPATSKYGQLQLIREDIKFSNRFGYEMAILEFSTDERKNDNFWGEGDKW
jgi:hypothetical protein